MLVDEDAAAQAYHTMQPNPGESTNKYRVRTEDAIKVMERLEIDLLSPQQQAMRYLKSLDRAMHGHVLIFVRCVTLRQIGAILL